MADKDNARISNEPFAKLFEYPEYGQAVVLNTTTDDGDPCVQIMVCGVAPFGICSMSMNFPDNEEGYDARDAAFAKIDEARVKTMLDGEGFDIIFGRDEGDS